MQKGVLGAADVRCCSVQSIAPLYILNCMGFCITLRRVDPLLFFCIHWLLGAK